MSLSRSYLLPLFLLMSACGGDELQSWHLAELSAEFTAADAAEVNTLDEYVALEEELRRQLDEEVYDQMDRGSGPVLTRYTPASVSDPRQRVPDWNRTLELPVENPRGGVLLLHGMSDSPYSLRALGETFQREGYLVLALRLPGHGTAPVGLTRVKAEDMQAAVRLAMNHLGERLGAKPVHMVGYSTGAPLALGYALDAREGLVVTPVSSLVLVSPAIGVSPAAALASWQRRLSLLPGLGRLAWLQIEPEFDPFKYNSFATNAAEQVFRLTRRVSNRIANMNAIESESGLPPILVLKSTVDATVSNQAVIDSLMRRLSPDRHELILFDINRLALASALLVDNPGLQTHQLMNDETLPFRLTLVGNESEASRNVVARCKPPFSVDVVTEDPIHAEWPARVASLSHIALPFAPEDPLYGAADPGIDGQVYLGQLAIEGERGLLRVSSDWLLRMRHNPFYDYFEQRILQWTATAGMSEQGAASCGGSGTASSLSG